MRALTRVSTPFSDGITAAVKARSLVSARLFVFPTPEALSADVARRIVRGERLISTSWKYVS